MVFSVLNEQWSVKCALVSAYSCQRNFSICELPSSMEIWYSVMVALIVSFLHVVNRIIVNLFRILTLACVSHILLTWCSDPTHCQPRRCPAGWWAADLRDWWPHLERGRARSARPQGRALTVGYLFHVQHASPWCSMLQVDGDYATSILLTPRPSQILSRTIA